MAELSMMTLRFAVRRSFDNIGRNRVSECAKKQKKQFFFLPRVFRSAWFQKEGPTQFRKRPTFADGPPFPGVLVGFLQAQPVGPARVSPCPGQPGSAICCAGAVSQPKVRSPGKPKSGCLFCFV